MPKTRTDIFFDTNILVYSASETPKTMISERLLRGGGVVSVQVLNEFTAVARRKLGFTFAEVRQVIEAVHATSRIVPMTLETHTCGLDIAERYALNVYDGLILAAAALAGCRTVYTEDMQDGLVVGAVTVKNPYIAL